MLKADGGFVQRLGLGVLLLIFIKKRFTVIQPKRSFSSPLS